MAMLVITRGYIYCLRFCPTELLRISTCQLADGLGREYSEKSDMWSLGMVLYAMCFTSLPFSHDDPHAPRIDPSKDATTWRFNGDKPEKKRCVRATAVTNRIPPTTNQKIRKWYLLRHCNLFCWTHTFGLHQLTYLDCWAVMYIHQGYSRNHFLLLQSCCFVH